MPEAHEVEVPRDRITKSRPAPSAEVIEVPTKVLRHYYVALRKGKAGYFHTDAAEYTVEGWHKIVEYGIDRYHRDGLEGADKLRIKGLDPNVESQKHAEHKDAMLRGEKVIRERGDSVPPIVVATRHVLFSALKGAGVKSKDIGKIGNTVESMWEAAEKALPAIVKQREDLDARAQIIAEALDLSGVKVA